MADLMKIEFQYEAHYARDNIAAVLRALAGAVLKNWDDRDEWSSSLPVPPLDVEFWMAQFDPAHLAWDDIAKEWKPRSENAPEWKFTEAFFAFSPLSTKAISITPIKDSDGYLTVRCLIYASVTNELLGDRQSQRMEDEWDRIRASRGEREPRKVGPDEDSPVYDEWWDERTSLDDTFSAWPRVKRHLRRIVESLRTVLPVRNSRIDSRLDGGDLDPVVSETLRGRRDLFPS